MILGYNHNVTYKGDVFHVQTEDSGITKPHIITLLYREGVILCSKKTSYADIIKMENLEEVVEDLMKEQHKDMLRRLKTGEFDERAFPQDAKKKVEEIKEEAVIKTPPPAPPKEKKNESIDEGVELLFKETVKTVAPPASPQAPKAEPKAQEKAVSLDDAILNFFGASK
jgi:hypothetical protein